VKSWLATLSLIAVTAVWGWTFVIVKDAIAVYGVMPFLAVRFLLAAVVLIGLRGRRLTRSTLRIGWKIGLVLAAGYLLQTWGLRFTTATNYGLITGLFVVVAPLADRALYRTRVQSSSAVAVSLSLVGMILLTGGSSEHLALGDLMTLGCALAFGLHIALLSRHARHHDPGALTTAQLLSVAVVFLMAWPVSGTPTFPPRRVWGAILITGLVASALAYLVQTSAQRRLSTARTAVILTMEPVFAGFFGFLLEGERLRGLQILGALLILSALAVGEILPALTRTRRKPPTSPDSQP